MKGIWVLIMLILCSSTVFSSLSVDIGDNSIPYVGINPVLTYGYANIFGGGVIDGDLTVNGNISLVGNYLNVTVVDFNISDNICLDDSCIDDWHDLVLTLANVTNLTNTSYFILLICLTVKLLYLMLVMIDGK